MRDGAAAPAPLRPPICVLVPAVGTGDHAADDTQVGLGLACRRLFVHRKGATRAFGPGHSDLPADIASVGQPVFIGGSMGTSSGIMAGNTTKPEIAFSSACHGAGRRISRHEALRRWRGRQVMDDLAKAGIIVCSPSLRGVAEEAPGAYKIGFGHRRGASLRPGAKSGDPASSHLRKGIGPAAGSTRPTTIAAVGAADAAGLSPLRRHRSVRAAHRRWRAQFFPDRFYLRPAHRRDGQGKAFCAAPFSAPL